MARGDGNGCWTAWRTSASQADFRSLPIPSSCRRRGWCGSPTARRSRPPFRRRRSRRLAGLRNMRRRWSCGRAWNIWPPNCSTRWSTSATARPAHGISRARLADNPYWPPELADRAGTLAHERYVVLAPLALSQTQDDKGRVRWTLFGGSEQGPARAFWKGFWTAPGRELPAETASASSAGCSMRPMASRWPGGRSPPGRIPHPARHRRPARSPYPDRRTLALVDSADLLLSEGSGWRG